MTFINDRKSGEIVKKYYYIKCILDFIFSLIGAIIALPLWLMISFFIKIESKGPIFFFTKQTRTKWQRV